MNVVSSETRVFSTIAAAHDAAYATPLEAGEAVATPGDADFFFAMRRKKLAEASGKRLQRGPLPHPKDLEISREARQVWMNAALMGIETADDLYRKFCERFGELSTENVTDKPTE